MKTRIFLVDFILDDGQSYGLHFECETREQADTMAENLARCTKVEVLGELVMSIDIEDVDTHLI